MVNEKTALSTVTSDSGFDMQRFEMALKIASVISRASLLPDHLRIDSKTKQPLPREDIEANCVLIVNQALRWGVDPFSIAPETYVVGGKLAYQGKLVAAVVNVRGNLRENLKYTYDGEGDDRTVTVTGHINGEAEPRTVTATYIKSVTRKDGKITDQWTRDPDQKLAYTGAVKWARKHVPQVMLGIIDETDEADRPDYSSHDALMGRVYQPTGPRLECDTSTPGTSDLPSVPVLDDSDHSDPWKIDYYIREIKLCQTRAAMAEVVERITKEPVNLIHPADVEALKDLARGRYKQLDTITETKVESDAVVSADEAFDQYYTKIVNEKRVGILSAMKPSIESDELLTADHKAELLDAIEERIEQ